MNVITTGNVVKLKNGVVAKIVGVKFWSNANDPLDFKTILEGTTSTGVPNIKFDLESIAEILA